MKTTVQAMPFMFPYNTEIAKNISITNSACKFFLLDPERKLSCCTFKKKNTNHRRNPADTRGGKPSSPPAPPRVTAAPAHTHRAHL